MVIRVLSINLKFLLLGCILLLSGCCEMSGTFSNGFCMDNKEFNDTYIDQDNKLHREQIEREVLQSKRRAPVQSEAPKPDYNWKPWENINTEIKNPAASGK